MSIVVVLSAGGRSGMCTFYFSLYSLICFNTMISSERVLTIMAAKITQHTTSFYRRTEIKER